MPPHPADDGASTGECQQGREKFLWLGLLLNSAVAWPTGARPQELPWMQRRHRRQPALQLTQESQRGLQTGICRGARSSPAVQEPWLLNWPLALFLVFNFFFWPHHKAFRISAPPVRDRTQAMAVVVRSPNHWAPRELPGWCLLLSLPWASP